jgi:hypothetical protein
MPNLKINHETDTDFEANECPRCGLERKRWSGNQGNGYRIENETFCCVGCAKNIGCRCASVIMEEIIQKSGVQVFEHGHLHGERRNIQVMRPGQIERRVTDASGGSSTS